MSSTTASLGRWTSHKEIVLVSCRFSLTRSLLYVPLPCPLAPRAYILRFPCCDRRDLSLGTNATFRRIGSVPRSAGVRRPEEQSAPVGERQIPAVCPVSAVLGQITLDLDLRSRLQVLLSQASSEQCVRGTAFDHPLFHRPVRLLDVDVDPGVGIDPFHFRNDARQLDGPVRVKFRGEGVRCRDRNGRQNQETDNTNRDD